MSRHPVPSSRASTPFLKTFLTKIGTKIGPQRSVKRRWRDYRTEIDRRPVKEFRDSLHNTDAAAVAAAMKDVREHGLTFPASHRKWDIVEPLINRLK